MTLADLRWDVAVARTLHRVGTALTCAAVAMVLGACALVSPYRAGAQSGTPASAASASASGSAPTSGAASAPPSAPGEATLQEGLRLYQAGQYRQSETHLKRALGLGLGAPAEVANANKHLAFIYCMTRRDTLCAAAFKAAKAADPDFALSKTEAGHPMWARTYKRALGLP